MPTYEDHLIEECAERAAERIADGAIIYQQWTCRHCGARQTMDQANQFFTSGHCEECGEISSIEKCNYMAIIVV